MNLSSIDDLSGPDVAYVYPDMKTMIVGQFKKGQLVSGLEAELNGLTYAENGLLRPLHQIKGKNSFTYSHYNEIFGIYNFVMNLDINECDPDPCTEDQKCLNTFGGYECLDPPLCDEGYARAEGSAAFG